MSSHKNKKKQKEKEIKELIKKKNDEINRRKIQEIENMKKNLIKKLYNDLYYENQQLYDINNFTFENFIFYFYKEIESYIDFKNPDYSKLFQIMDLKVKSKFKKENKYILNEDVKKKKNNEEEDENDEENEWKLIFKYQQILYEENEKKKKKEREDKEKKYYEDLKEQIKMKKNPIDDIEKNKEDAFLFDENIAFKQLQKAKVKNLQNFQNFQKEKDYLKEEFLEKLKLKNEDNEEEVNTKKKNQALTYNNNILKNYLSNKDEQDDLISKLVDQIMNEKKINKLNNILQIVKDKNKEHNLKKHNIITTNIEKAIEEDDVDNNYNYVSDLLKKK